MPISMLKYIKTLRHVSISTDHHKGVCTSKLLNYLKNTEFKILKIIPGVVAAKRVAGIRGETCRSVFMYFNIEIGILD